MVTCADGWIASASIWSSYRDGSITYLLDLREQLSVWRHSFENLAPGGRFVVDTTMPNFAAYADSFANPPRTLVEVDHDATGEARKIRLVRRRTVTYLPDEQRA